MALYKRIAIIGGGPAGLAAAKALVLEPAKFEIDLFERRDNTGGLWYYGGDKSKVSPQVPSVKPDFQEIWDPEGGFENRYFSPLYDQLETNIVSRLMKYNHVRDDHFTPDVKEYVGRHEVLEYVRKYKESIPEGINYHFNKNITELSKVKDWQLTFEDSVSLEKETKTYDAVVVANGHFEVPYIPDTPGLAEWAKADPKSITHAKYFTDGERYRDQNVIVVGALSSGIDLSIQISTVAKSTYVSVKDDPANHPNPYKPVTIIPLITKYDHANRSVTLVNGDILEDIDSVVFCTGYLYSFPFLKKYKPSVTDGYQVKELYRQIFDIEDPSIVFIALPKDVVPMPLAEAQTAVVARVFSGRLQLPSVEERRDAYKKELGKKGPGKQFHSMPYPEDVEYCRSLYTLIDEAGLTGEGLVPSVWGEQRANDRSNTKNDKMQRLGAIMMHAYKLRQQHLVFKLPERENERERDTDSGTAEVAPESHLNGVSAKAA